MSAVSRRRSLLPALLFLLASSAQAEPEWSRYLNLDVEGTTHRLAGSADVQLPLAQGPNWAFMGDLRFTGADDDSQQGSLGLAYRRLLGGERFLFGVNAFYDFAETAHGNDFTQGSLGVELMWPHVRVHANGYFAGSDLESRGFPTLEEVELVGTDVMRVDTDFFEGAIDGWDAGVAFRVPFERHQLWLRGGYRDFDRPGFTDLGGTELGFEWIGELATEGRWSGSQLVVGGLWQENGRGDERDESVVHVGVRIPLNESAGTARRHPGEDWDVHAMQSRIRRQRAVKVGNTSVSASFALVDSLTGENVNVFFVDGSGGGDGTQDQPLTLEDALAAAGPSDVLFFLGGGGDIQLTAPFTLEANQALVGLGTDTDSASVPLPEGFNLTITADGGMPTLVQTGMGPVIELADGNHLSGLELVGGENGLHGDGITDLSLSDLVIRDSTGHGVFLESFSGVLDTTGSITITNVGGDGILVSDPGSTLNLGDLTIMGTAGNGLTVTGGSPDTTYHFDSVTISDTGGHGIAYFGAVSNATVGGDFSIENTGGDGMTVQAGSTLSLDVAGDASFDSLGERGIEVIDSAADFSFGSLTVENTDSLAFGFERAGIHYENASGSVAVTGDAAIRNIGGDGIFTEDANLDLSFGSLSIDGTTNTGMSFEEATDVTLTVAGHADIRNVAADGIQVEDGGINADLSFGSLSIDNAGVKGIELDEGQGTFTVDGHAELTNLGSQGIEVKDDSDFDLSFGSLTIDGSDGGGIHVNFRSDADITITGDTIIRNVEGAAIETFRDSHADLDMQGNLTIDGVDSSDAIRFSDATGSLTVGGATTLDTVNLNAIKVDDGADADLSFGSLDVGTVGGNGIEFSDSSMGSVTVTGDASIDQAGMAGIIVEEGSDADLSFGSLTVGTTGGHAIAFSEAGMGSVTVTGHASIDQAGAGALVAEEGAAVDFAFGSLDVVTTGTSGIEFSDSSQGSVTVTGDATFGSVSRHGLIVEEGSEADLSFGSLDIADTGNQGIHFTDSSSGSVTVTGNADIGGTGGDGIAVENGSEADLSFGSLDIGDTGDDGITFDNAGRGSLTVTGDATLGNPGDHGLAVRNGSEADLSFGSLTVGTTGGNGIDFSDGSRGSVTVTGDTIITETGGAGLVVEDGAGADLSFGSLTIGPIGGHGIEFSNGSSGSVTVAGDAMLGDTGRAGIMVEQGSEADLSFGSLTIGTTSSSGIEFTEGGKGSITVTGDASIDETSNSGIVVKNGAEVDMSFGSLTIGLTGGDGIDFGGGGDGSITVTGDVDLDETVGNGISAEDGAQADFSFGNLTIGMAGGHGISLTNGSSGTWTITGNTTIGQAAGNGIFFSDGPDFDITSGSLSITNTGSHGIELTNGPGGSITITGSTLIDQVAGDGIFLENGAGVAFTFDDLTISNAAVDGIESSAGGDGSITVTGTAQLINLGNHGLNVAQSHSDFSFANLVIDGATTGIDLTDFDQMLTVNGGSITNVTNGIDLSNALGGLIENVAFDQVTNAVVRATGSTLGGGTGNTAANFNQIYEDLGGNTGTMTFTTPPTVLND
ncbi:MAG: inverse autotransporter beta domain-containing protein [Acidobacteriota bacterium]